MRATLPQRWMRWLLLGGFAGALILLFWSAVIEPRLIVEEEYDVTIPNLPPEWENKRVALIADPQVGLALSNTGTLRRIVARLVKLRPAAVCIAGDFIYEPVTGDGEDVPAVRHAARTDTDEVVELLRPLTNARIPTYAVLGNHDTESTGVTPNRATVLRDALQRAGIRVLIDEAVPLAPTAHGEEGKLWLLGLSSQKRRADQRRAALQQVPSGAPRLVLLHNPNRFEELPADSAPLVMTGHTHGGQIKFPFLLLRRLLGRVNAEPRAISGWMDDCGQPGNRLYINRGIGFSRLPLRFNAPPEITIFTLRGETRA